MMIMEHENGHHDMVHIMEPKAICNFVTTTTSSHVPNTLSQLPNTPQCWCMLFYWETNFVAKYHTLWCTIYWPQNALAYKKLQIWSMVIYQHCVTQCIQNLVETVEHSKRQRIINQDKWGYDFINHSIRLSLKRLSKKYAWKNGK